MPWVLPPRFSEIVFKDFSDVQKFVGLEAIEIVWEFYLNGADERNHTFNQIPLKSKYIQTNDFIDFLDLFY